jgi:23S rRNA (uracil1939-C5)-methyltransferase
VHVSRIVELDIEALTAAGDGLANLNGREVVVPFTLPGERVHAELSPAPGGSARVVEVIRPSPHRVKPGCVHFGPGAIAALPDGSRPSPPCGGCAWQHIAYGEQLRLKTARVDRLVRTAVPRAPATRLMLPGADPANPWGYRQKVHFVFANVPVKGRRDGRLVMGHYARNSRRVVAVRECPVHDSRGNALAFRLYEAFARADVSAAELDGGAALPRSTLRAVVVRAGLHVAELLATLVVTRDADRRLRDATRRALGRHPPTGLHLNVHPKGDTFIFGRETRMLTGKDRIREEVAGVSFLLSPTAFFQTNVRAAETLVNLVLDALPAPRRVLDLYAGVGLFAIPLAKAGHTVTAIEENRAAVADGEANVRLNRIDPARCRFVASRVAKALRSPAEADAVVLDPPRDGCEPSVLEQVFARLRPETVVYVSCNPDVLASDLRLIQAHGWKILAIQPVDMFPHTAHIETVVTLRRAAR